MADSQSLYVIDWKSGRMYNYSCVRDVISMPFAILWCHLCLLLTLLDRVGVASRLLAVNTASATWVDHHQWTIIMRLIMLRSSTTCRIVKVKKSNSLSRHISNFAYRRTRNMLTTGHRGNFDILPLCIHRQTYRQTDTLQCPRMLISSRCACPVVTILRVSQSMRELEMPSSSPLCVSVSPPTPASLKEDICEKYLVICQILKWGRHYEG